ncbi:MAG: beta galactosidase jelly roll domain-containing protein [Cyclobacteriaceae bacterium]
MKKIIIISSLLCSIAMVHAQDFTLLKDLRGTWKFNIGDDLAWADYHFDDENWDNIFVPSRWENEGFAGYDGFAWYRKAFDFEKANESDYHTLDLGYIDDSDEVYFNGELIGRSGSLPPNYRTAYGSLRRYFIPSELIKQGKNIVAVRVYDRSLDGGIMKGKQGLYIRNDLPSKIVSLEGMWNFKSGDNSEWADPDIDDSDWSKMKVPGYWKGYKDHSFTKMFFRTEEIAWYRKEFRLPDYLKTEELVIVLGKIDDFDEVYLNGHLIGSTNDGREFGDSQSYSKTRIYDLPAEYLHRYGPNILAVKVTDIGIDAGIYEGPVAIGTRRHCGILLHKY